MPQAALLALPLVLGREQVLSSVQHWLPLPTGAGGKEKWRSGSLCHLSRHSLQMTQLGGGLCSAPAALSLGICYWTSS